MPSRFKQNCSALLLLLIFICSFLQAPVKAQAPSSLAEGQWYKMAVTQAGVYQLSCQYLQKNGIISNSTDPRNIRIYGQAGGMLPQPNAEDRPQDLLENAILVEGEADGRFDPQDHILFYAQGPDKVWFNAEAGTFEYEKNLYSDTAYYFITVHAQRGKRIDSKPDLDVNSPLITRFDAYAAYEKDEKNILSSGRRWFGEQFGYHKSSTFELPVFDLAENSTINIRTACLSMLTTPSSFAISANGQLAQTLAMPTVLEREANPYAERGKIVEQTNQINTSSFADLDRLSIQVDFESSQTGSAYLDYLFVSALCKLKYRNEALFFRSLKSLQHPLSRFNIQTAPKDLLLWDVTVPHEVALQNSKADGSIRSFGTATTVLKEFVAFRPSDALEPVKLKKVARQNLRGDTSPEFLIVTHPSLLSEAQRLAAFRRQHSGIQAKVVTTEQIYNEFSSGAQDVTAIRDYVRYLYQKGGKKLRYLLLFGRGYYDYKKRTEPDYNLVPVYQSYNSTHPVLSYASDDYYGFLEEQEGSWQESEAGNHSLEIGIGRLPVRNIREGRQIVDKLIRYDTQPSTSGNWRNSLLFVAEDGDNNVHHKDAEKLAALVQEEWPVGNINKIYMGAYPLIKTANGKKAPMVTEAINKAVEKGALMINYTGHGRKDLLAKANVVTKSEIEKWDNQYRMPLVITATCEFGQHDDKIPSGAENMLLNPTGGAIGLLTAARPVYAHTNFEINSAFYKFAFPQDGQKPQRLGDIIRLTKNRGVPGTGVVNRNFILLGDPSLTLAYPKKRIYISDLKFEESLLPADTFGAFDRVKASGYIPNRSGQPDPAFNGLVEISVFEKPVEYQTTDSDAPQMNFTIRDNVIFRGKATVKEGRFSFAFVVPKSIRYNIGSGKISLYALDTTSQTDATGHYDRFFIGGKSHTNTMDKTPPEIEAYLNDSTFKSGDKVGQQSMLIAHFKDESGINITNSAVEWAITGNLDGETTFDLSEYYVSEPDDFSQGTLRFPLEALAPGNHRLSLTAKDTYQNLKKVEIEFIVSDKGDFQVYKLFNYPNPFRNSTRFVVEHSRAGEDIEADILIYKLNGSLIRQDKRIISASRSRQEIMQWDGRSVHGEKLTSGIYLFKIILRSLKDSTIAEKMEKLVILN